MVNANELRAAWVRKGLTQAEVAHKLNITPKTLSSKLHKGVLGSDEIEQLMILLDIKDPMPIFFDNLVTLKDTKYTVKTTQI